MSPGLLLAAVLCVAAISQCANEADHKKAPEITVATYNIWNVMFHWEIRKLYIATLIRRHSPDIIALQEVRAHKNTQRNQVQELQALLPEYKYAVYHPVNNVHVTEEVHPPGWEWEGLGLLSKHKILSQQVVNLTKGNGPDINLRAILSAQISIYDREVSVVNVHMSYDKFQQCINAADILSFLHSTGTENAILLGDMNAVDEFPWPVNALMHGKFDTEAPVKCLAIKKPVVEFKGFVDGFRDAWHYLYPGQTGYTFSNMPTPGLQSRPDRILVSQTGLRIQHTFRDGDGKEYGQLYKKSLYWQRLYTLYQISKYKAFGKSLDYTCHWNCGPHGSCRCGICVKGDDQNTCASDVCFECNPLKLFFAQFIAILLLISLIYTSFYAISLVVSFFFKPTSLVIFKRSKYVLFRSKYNFVSVFLLVLVGVSVLRFLLKETLEIVEAQLEEELFPSDHLMVISKIAFTY